MYAKFTAIANVEHGDFETDRSFAVCEERNHLANKGPVKFFMINVLLLPLMFLILIATVVRSLHREIHAIIAPKSGHHNLTGLALTGMTVTLYVLGCDIIAMYYSCGVGDVVLISCATTAFLMIYSVVASFILILILLFISCKLVNECCNPSRPGRGNLQQYNDNGSCIGYRRACTSCSNCILMRCLRFCFRPFFWATFGYFQQNRLWDLRYSGNLANSRAVWIIALLFTAPVISISSHMSFIVVAWLTDAPQASSVALICFAILLYFFFMFRQCYMVNKRDHCFTLRHCCNRRESKHQKSEVIYELLNSKCVMPEENTSACKFDMTAFCITLSWGVFLLFIIVLLLFAFFELPIITVSLLSELVSTFEILVFLISILITYRILTMKEPTISRFLRRVRGTFINKAGSEFLSSEIKDTKNVDNAEAAGILLGELAEVVVQGHPRP